MFTQHVKRYGASCTSPKEKKCQTYFLGEKQNKKNVQKMSAEIFT